MRPGQVGAGISAAFRVNDDPVVPITRRIAKLERQRFVLEEALPPDFYLRFRTCRQHPELVLADGPALAVGKSDCITSGRRRQFDEATRKGMGTISNAWK